MIWKDISVLLCLSLVCSFFDVIRNGIFAVDDFVGVDEMDELEKGSSTYLTSPNKLEIADETLSVGLLRNYITEKFPIK